MTLKMTGIDEEPGKAVALYGADAGGGLENVSAGEQLIPFYRVLQPLSPEVVDKTVEGAQAGMIINTASKKLYDGEIGLMMLPAVRDYNYAKFTPREQGGGFHGLFAPDDPVVLDLKAKHGGFAKLPMPDGDELIETYYLFGLFQGPDDLAPQKGCLAFASTNIKAYKQWITRTLGMIIPGVGKPYPIWANMWKFSSEHRKNKKGSWYGIKLESPKLLAPNDALFTQGREFWQLWRAGTVKADYSEAKPEAGGEEIPF